MRRSTPQVASPYSLLQPGGPSPLMSAAAGGPPASLPMPPPSPFFTPFPAALYQAGLLVNMYAAAAAAAFSAASGASCPPEMLSPPPPNVSSAAATSRLDAGHVVDRADPSLISPGNDGMLPELDTGRIYPRLYMPWSIKTCHVPLCFLT